MKKLFTMITLLLFVFSLYADTIYITGGNEYKCQFISMDNENIIVKMKSSGEKKIFKKSDVKKLLLDKRRTYYFTKSINDIKDSDILWAFNYDTNNKFQNSNYILLLKKITVNTGKNPTITEKYIYKVLTHDGIRPASNRFFIYMKKYENFAIDYAISISPKGAVESIYDNLIEDENPLSSFPMYENIHSVKFAIPGIIDNSLVVFQVTKTIKNLFQNPIIVDETFYKEVPAIKQQIIISNPKNMAFTILHKKKMKIKTQQNKWIFSYMNTPQIYDTTLLPDNKAFAPRVIIYQKIEPQTFSKKFNDFIQNDDKSNLENFIKNIQLNTSDKNEIISKIYFYIQNNYIYVPLQPKGYSYLPNHLNDIINSKVVNNLDKVYLAYQILKYFNINSNILFVGKKFDYTEKDKYFSSSRYYFVILKTTINNKPIYLDFSSNLNPFNVLNKEAYGQKYYDPINNNFGKIPEFNAYSNDFSYKYILTGNINKNGDLNGTLIVKMSKLNDLSLRELIYKSVKEREIAIQNYLNQFFNMAVLKDYSIENLNNLNDNVVVKMNFLKSNFAQVLDDRIMLFNIPLMKFNSYVVGSNKRQVNVYLGSKNYSKYTIDLKIPSDFSIADYPKGKNVHSKYFSVNMLINAKGNHFNFNGDEYYSGELAPVKYYFKYKKYISILNKQLNYLIVSEKK